MRQWSSAVAYEKRFPNFEDPPVMLTMSGIHFIIVRHTIGKIACKTQALTIWHAEVLISQISPESAAKLPNATTPFTNDTSHYIVELDVFHQLHCLNMLRKLVYPDVYTMDLTSGSEKAIDNIFHMEHCYEQLRQSLQCSSDISTIYWEWSEKKQRMFGNVRTTHTCKNFGKIRDWAVEHKAETDLDFYKHVEGAPLLQE
jgi:hypothetical protein